MPQGAKARRSLQDTAGRATRWIVQTRRLQSRRQVLAPPPTAIRFSG